MPTGGGESAASAARVRVLPGSALQISTPPPPPPTPPPKPSALVKIAVVGDACSGKTALVHRFIHRRYANAGDGGGGEIGEGDAYGAASAASNSLTSLGASYGGLDASLAEYHKKDITIYYKRQRPQSIETDQEAVCVRVQIWDMNMHQRLGTCLGNDEHDAASVTSASSALHTPGFDANIKPLLPLLKRINGVAVVCRCPHSLVESISTSSNADASYVSHFSNASCGGWPELDFLEEKIRRWVSFLDEQLNHRDEKRPSIVVLLSCADLVLGGYSPREWMQLLERMQTICKEYEIASWKMCTSMDTSGAIIDEGRSPNRRSTLMQRICQQQQQLLEDLEDAVEGAFVDMISSHLDRSSPS
ncbi:hypothetical protein ACHAXT_002912 [Thalassiosira profunda]